MLDQATLLARAVAFDVRRKGIAQQYDDRLPAAVGTRAPPLSAAEEIVWRNSAIARNTVYVALTGDYAVTNASLRDELDRRHVSMVPVPGEKPYL